MINNNIAWRIFSLIIVTMVSVLSAVAQRQPNLSLAHYWSKSEGTLTFIKDNDAIVIDGNGNAGNYFFQWRIVNNGATLIDTIAVSDTVKIKTNWTTYRIVWGQGQFSNGMKQQDTVFITPAINPVTLPLPSGLTTSQDSVLTQWCDSVYFVSGDLSNPALEADVSDDIVCDTVFVTYWRTHIEEVVEGSGIILYPNPASGLLNVHYKDMTNVTAVKIVNTLGQSVYSIAVSSPERVRELVTMDITGLSPGLYSLRLETRTGAIVETFYIQ